MAQTLFAKDGAGEIFQHGAHLPLHRMVGTQIFGGIGAHRAGEAEKAGVLAGAIVMQRRRRAGPRQRISRGLRHRPMRAAAQRRGIEAGVRQHPLDAGDVCRLAAVRRAGERQLLVAEAISVGGAAFDEGKACNALIAERGNTGAATSPTAITLRPSASATATAPRWRLSTSGPRVTSTRTGLLMFRPGFRIGISGRPLTLIADSKLRLTCLGFSISSKMATAKSSREMRPLSSASTTIVSVPRRYFPVRSPGLMEVGGEIAVQSKS